jgi:SAM-dependent methyltransferase
MESRKSKKYNKGTEAALGFAEIKASLRSLIKIYKKRAAETEDYLSKHPDEWGQFQNEFNSEVNAIFREIMNFEKESLANGNAYKIEKLRSIFINKIRELFLKSDYFKWCLSKPYGYSGDFKIIDDMYQNNPSSNGFNRLFDNYFQVASICAAVRNRKEDFKRLIAKFVNERKEEELRIMNLGCGPCRDVQELFMTRSIMNDRVIFDCYDHDDRAINFAKSLLGDNPSINFIKENALRLAATKNISSKIDKKYDLIYVMGVFDYFNHKISVKLVSNLKKLLKEGGVLAVSNVRDRYSNPSIHCMEWVGDWILIYRTEEEFNKIFLDAGFKEANLKIQHEQQGIMQYVIATSGKSSK